MIEFNGLVLFSKPYKERDLLVKIFTEQAGKKMFFVRNMRRRNQPLTQAVMNFCYGSYVGKLQANGLSFLNSAKVVERCSTIQADIFLSAYATYLLHLVDVVVEDGEVDPSLYAFTKKSLQLIDEGVDAEVITNIFELQLLSRFGVQLVFDTCVNCGKRTGKFDFSSRRSGVVCEEHWVGDRSLYRASARAIYFARQFSALSLEQIGSIRLGAETKQQLRQLIDMLYEEYVGIRLKSKTFIDQMKTWEEKLR